MRKQFNSMLWSNFRLDLAGVPAPSALNRLQSLDELESLWIRLFLILENSHE